MIIQSDGYNIYISAHLTLAKLFYGTYTFQQFRTAHIRNPLLMFAIFAVLAKMCSGSYVPENS